MRRWTAGVDGRSSIAKHISCAGGLMCPRYTGLCVVGLLLTRRKPPTITVMKKSHDHLCVDEFNPTTPGKPRIRYGGCASTHACIPCEPAGRSPNGSTPRAAPGTAPGARQFPRMKLPLKLPHRFRLQTATPRLQTATAHECRARRTEPVPYRAESRPSKSGRRHPLTVVVRERVGERLVGECTLATS